MVEYISLPVGDNLQAIEKVLTVYAVNRGAMSSVRASYDCELAHLLQERLKDVLFITPETPMPLQIRYKMTETMQLGSDRIAAAVGATYLRPNTDLLVIDAGTAITCDLTRASGVFLGGSISPGMTTRFKALALSTDKLPCLEAPEVLPPIICDSTERAIQSGVVNGIIMEIDGFINAIKRQYCDVFVFLTGGDAEYFQYRLKNRVQMDEYLVLKGINRLLDYNAKN